MKRVDFLRFVIVSTTFFFSSCKSTKTKDPIFIKDLVSLSKDIDGIMSSEKFNIHGTQTNTNGELTSELTLELINPKNKLTDTSLINNIGKEIAVLLKQSLKKPIDYTTYNVFFVNQIIDGGLTKSNYTQQVYKSEDLNSNAYVITLGERFDSSTYLAAGKTTFGQNDSIIASVVSYYYFDPKPALSLKIFKEIDNKEILLFVNDLGQLKNGSNYSYNELKVSDFYKSKRLGSGSYRIEYWIGGTEIGRNFFKLL